MGRWYAVLRRRMYFPKAEDILEHRAARPQSRQAEVVVSAIVACVQIAVSTLARTPVSGMPSRSQRRRVARSAGTAASSASSAAS